MVKRLSRIPRTNVELPDEVMAAFRQALKIRDHRERQLEDGERCPGIGGCETCNEYETARRHRRLCPRRQAVRAKPGRRHRRTGAAYVEGRPAGGLGPGTSSARGARRGCQDQAEDEGPADRCVPWPLQRALGRAALPDSRRSALSASRFASTSFSATSSGASTATRVTGRRSTLGVEEEGSSRIRSIGTSLLAGSISLSPRRLLASSPAKPCRYWWAQ